MKVYGLSGSQWLQVVAAYSGWLMDGYISISYLFVAETISKILFPATYVGFIATMGGFVIGAVARFAGSLYLGDVLGDRIGRRKLLIVSVVGFSVFSASIGLLPTYSSAGLIVPVALYILMIITGMFAGAEYGGGTALSMESIPPERRGFVGSFVQSGFGTGYFIVALVFAFVSSHFSMGGIGWRIMFFMTLIPGAIILLLRLGATETPVFSEMSQKGAIEKMPLFSLLRESWKAVLIGLLITNALIYINTSTFGFWPVYMQSFGGVNGEDAGLYIALINFVSLLGVWSGGMLSGLIGGRRRPMLGYAILFAVLVAPFTYLSLSREPVVFVSAMSVIAFTEAMIFSTLPAFLSESYSKRYRVTATGFVYNGGALAGSWALLVITANTNASGSNLGPVWILNMLAASMVLIVGIALARETWVSGKDKIIN